jgi:UPF0755 protein
MLLKDPKHNTGFGVGFIIAIVILAYMYVVFYTVPNDFPVGKNFVVEENETLVSISNRLKDNHIITSPHMFRAAISFLGKDKEIQLGGYEFDKPLTLFQVVDVFRQGKPKSPLLSVTIPEGSTSLEVAGIIAKAVPSITKEMFTQVAMSNNANGKLFPSTYFLLPSYTADDIVKIMTGTYVKKTIPLDVSSVIKPPLTSEHDVIVLASILEGEANTVEDMKIVAGILLTRLSKGMPLQVDAAPITYKQKGLPKDPINNPGLIALDAVLHPTPSPYLFYITGNDGKMYYAKTFEEHKAYIRKYLK